MVGVIVGVAVGVGVIVSVVVTVGIDVGVREVVGVEVDPTQAATRRTRLRTTGKLNSNPNPSWQQAFCISSYRF